MEVKGQFTLDKVLEDTRHSPRALYPPTDEDVLIIDQHTNDQGLIEYTKTVGVVRNANNSDGKLEFEWVVTDNNLKELVKNSKYPEKLFKYSPEFIPIGKTDKYDQGEYGQLKSIAITNMANDSDAITTKISNLIKNIINKNKDLDNDGDNMDEQKVKEMIDATVGPINQRLEALDGIDEALEKLDMDKIQEGLQKLETLESLNELPGKVEELEKNIKLVTKPIDDEKEELVKNLKTNQDLISEESLVKMNIEDLRKMNQKYTREPQGGFGADNSPEDIVAQINAEYGTDVGATLGKTEE